MQRAPQYPESHNLKGLVCEARGDYESAVASYRLARLAARVFAGKVLKSYPADISINLTRSLCMVIYFITSFQVQMVLLQIQFAMLLSFFLTVSGCFDQLYFMQVLKCYPYRQEMLMQLSKNVNIWKTKV